MAENMSAAQKWVTLAVLLAAVLGGLWIAYDFFTLSERRAWLACIKDTDQLSAQNLVCGSQYPKPYDRFMKEFKGQ